MKHYVLVRFNLKWSLPSEVWRDDSWLKKRLQLFKRYCLPSLQGQSCQDFEVLILLGEGSPNWICEEFRSLLEFHNNFKFHFVGFLERKFKGVWRWRQLNEALWDKFEGSLPLVTTRMDSDDVIASDFVEGIQNSIGSDSEFLSHPEGYILREGQVGRRNLPKNQFVTFVEHTSRGRTSFQSPHRKVVVREISTIPMWCWVLHGQNMCELRNPTSLNQNFFKEAGVKEWEVIQATREEIRRFLV